MDIFTFITMAGGLATMLYGMDLMGDGLKSSSAETLKRIIGKVTGNAFSGFLLGLVITAIIQSSTASIIIAIGLLGVGVLNLKQTVCIAMGANVGTTITAQIIRLLDVENSGGFLQLFTPSTLAPIALTVGMILIMSAKKDSYKNVGKIFVGFGILFLGLLTMTNTMKPLAQTQEFKNLIIKLSDTPVITMVISSIFTFITQSSSSTVGVLQTLCSTGLINFRIAYFYVMGAALGTCVITSLLCTIGTKADAKRVSLINVIFNFTGIIIFIVVMEILYSLGYFPNLWTSVATSGMVADFQTVFKLCNALVFLPLVPVLMKIACKVIKDDTVDNEKKIIPADKFDTHLFRSPALAIDQCQSVVVEMAEEIKLNFNDAMNQLAKYDKDVKGRIYSREDYIDELTDRCSQYLIELSPNVVSDAESETIGDLLQAVSEFERIGDLSINVQEVAERMEGKDQGFSRLAKKETKVLAEAISEIISLSHIAIQSDDLEAAKNIEPLEEVIDDLVDLSRDRHIERLKAGKCNVDAGIAFLDILTNLERISDQCSNIALLVLKHHYPDINKHEYISQLHKGESESFNRRYNSYKGKYFTELQKIDTTSANQ